MRKLHLGLAVLCVGLAAVAVAACGEDETRGESCTVDTDCHANELCFTPAQRCVQTCGNSNDCEDESNPCEPVSDTDPRRVCKCSTGEPC